MDKNEIKKAIESGKTSLGIELGSTRIKAVLIAEDHSPIASGSFEWENQYEHGVWTYSLDIVWKGLQESYRNLSKEVSEKYGVTLTTIGAIGFSAMMHGYLAFGKDGNLLVPFRTWRNTMTGQAAEKLTNLFQFNIPQRWSIAHLYQAILNKEAHIKDISHQTTLAGYVHWKLTGQKVLGVGEASGMFPIDSTTNDFDKKMLGQFNDLLKAEKINWTLQDILPKVLVAGEAAGTLTEEGAKLLDPSGTLKAGIPLCPPEGDAGTGMVATNSVAERTGNVSAGPRLGDLKSKRPGPEVRHAHLADEVHLVFVRRADPLGQYRASLRGIGRFADGAARAREQHFVVAQGPPEAGEQRDHVRGQLLGKQIVPVGRPDRRVDQRCCFIELIAEIELGLSRFAHAPQGHDGRTVVDAVELHAEPVLESLGQSHPARILAAPEFLRALEDQRAVRDEFLRAFHIEGMPLEALAVETQ